jgi:hypothetical protein
MTLPVYVAGATRNIERTERFIAKVDAHPLLHITYAWTAAVRLETAKGVSDKELTDAQRVHYAVRDLRGVVEAAAFVCLAESPMSSGQSVELGGALIRKLLAEQMVGTLIRLPFVIVSGGSRLSIFTATDPAVSAMADHEVFDDDEAFELLVRFAKGLENRHTDA